jgi:hypothetical protein
VATARACRARGEYRPLTKVSSSKRTALPGSRPHLLQMVQACGQHQRAPLRALLVRIDGMGPWGGAVSRAHQGAGVGAVRGGRRNSVLILRTQSSR